ncbi:MAG TPA: DUF1579 family protein [Vicinamibacteria bacterium]|nr:DUF1579 family protein [Vicinamibacteria bacterium]
MSRPWTAAFVAGALCLALPCADAQEMKGKPADKPMAMTSPPPMPKPAPEMAQLQPFEGSWTCEGTMAASPFGPGGKSTSTVKARSTLGGFWQEGVIKGTMPGMPPFEGMFHTTYDPAAKRYVMLWVDNMGAWAQSTAPGWEGDKMVFAGDSYMAGQKVASRDIFTKGSGTFKHVGELQMDGRWVPLFDETCRKTGSAAK